MVEKTIRSSMKKVKVENIEVVYNLVFKNAFYSLECYTEGAEQQNYSYIEDFTDDEGEAEGFLHLMAKGKVLPIHIKDMAEDYFGR